MNFSIDTLSFVLGCYQVQYNFPKFESRWRNIRTAVEMENSTMKSVDMFCTTLCCVLFPFILDVRLVDVPAGVTQEEGRTGFLIRLPSEVPVLIFLARSIQPFLPLVDREVEFRVLTI